MISYECKNCGGELEEISKGIGRCTSCRGVQPMPSIMSVQFNRANRLRLEDGNFDDARVIYENIIKENPDEAEAYWGIVLCRYGIEYVKDSRTGEYLPTCNRAIETPIKKDSDFELAVSKATDEKNRKYYLEQADLIDNIMKDIMQIVNSESPYDIFISFKDRDEYTKFETKDSKKATEIYYALTSMGYKVFFSKVTLKGKAGEKYEPYIYAALKSSKVMVLVGTKPEYMNARWVKNEWSRFNKMRQNGEAKLLLPVYEDMDAYDIPFELTGLQALHMGDLDFLENLKKNIEGFFGESIESRNERNIEDNIKKVIESGLNVTDNSEKWNESGEKLLRNGFYEEAIKEFDKAIEENPTSKKTYWNRLLARLRCSDEKVLLGKDIDFSYDKDYLMACEFSDEEDRVRYQNIQILCKDNKELQNSYTKAVAEKDSNFKKHSPEIARMLNQKREYENSFDSNVYLKQKYDKAFRKSNIIAGCVMCLFDIIILAYISTYDWGGFWDEFGFLIQFPIKAVASVVFFKLTNVRKAARSWYLISLIFTVGFSSYPMDIFFICRMIISIVSKIKHNKLIEQEGRDRKEYNRIVTQLETEKQRILEELYIRYSAENANKYFELKKININGMR